MIQTLRTPDPSDGGGERGFPARPSGASVGPTPPLPGRARRLPPRGPAAAGEAGYAPVRRDSRRIPCGIRVPGRKIPQPRPAASARASPSLRRRAEVALRIGAGVGIAGNELGTAQVAGNGLQRITQAFHQSVARRYRAVGRTARLSENPVFLPER